MAERYSVISFDDSGHKLKAEHHDFPELELSLKWINGQSGLFRLSKPDAIEFAEWILEELTGGE